MIFSKHKRHKEYLQEQFANRSVHRVYHALVEGVPEKKSGKIHEWLVEDKFLRVKSTSKKTPNAKEAITYWNLEDNDEFASLILSLSLSRRGQAFKESVLLLILLIESL